MEETKYLYTIQHPRRPIKGLSFGGIVRVSKTLPLTKEDVATAIKLATVYRRFDNGERLEKVTIGNIDRFHNEKYMTEEEYKKFVNNQKGINNGKVNVPPVKDETVVKKEEGPTTRVDKVPESATPAKEASTDDKSEETSKDEDSTATVKESDDKDQKVSDPVRPINTDHQNNQFNGKKKNYNNKK